jgi:hypothetical protein
MRVVKSSCLSSSSPASAIFRSKDADMNAADVELDVRDHIGFTIALAWQDADLVAEFLKSAGIEPGTPLPKDALVKLAMYCRLRLWEEIGVTPGGAAQVPAARAVFADIIRELEGKPPRIQIDTLSRQIHNFAKQRLTWPQSGATFTLDDQADSSDLLDRITVLLWNSRHLAEVGGSSAPVSSRANLDHESAMLTAGSSATPSPSTN